MGYRKWKPSERLAPYVESYWLQESAATDAAAPTRVLPTGRADLVLEFGDPFVHVSDCGVESVCPALTLTGQLTRATSFRATGRTGLLLVNFHPWATHFFGPAADLTDEVVDLSSIIGDARGRGLADEVRNAERTGDRLRIVERFLLDHLPRERPNARVVEAVRRLNGSYSAPSIAELATFLGMSRRQLGRLFTKRVGTSPKIFSRIRRFQFATRMRSAKASWGEIAAACGYTDQSHLSKECVRLAGVTPGVLDRRMARGPLHSYFNGDGPEYAALTSYL